MESIKVEVLMDLFNNKHQYKVNKVQGHKGIPDDNFYGIRDEYNEYFLFYKHPEFPENLFMRESYRTDSYGGDDRLYAVDFVTGKEKTIIVYEPF